MLLAEVTKSQRNRDDAGSPVPSGDRRWSQFRKFGRGKSKELGTTKSFYGKHSSKNPEPLQLKTALRSKLPETIALKEDASSHTKGHHCNLFTVIIIYYEYCIAIKLMLREWRFTLSAKVLKRQRNREASQRPWARTNSSQWNLKVNGCCLQVKHSGKPRIYVISSDYFLTPTVIRGHYKYNKSFSGIRLKSKSMFEYSYKL